MIKLKDFVDVNLTSVAPSSNEENKTVVYIYGGSTLVDEYLNPANYEGKLSQFDATTKDFINQFFTLGGASLRVICVATQNAQTTSTILANNTKFVNQVKALEMSEVAIVLRQALEGNQSEDPESESYDSTGYHYETYETSGTSGLDTLLASIKAVVDDQGTAYRKLIVRYYAPENGSTYLTQEIIGGTVDQKVYAGLKKDINLIWKLCFNEKDLASVLAYLSKVTLVNPDSLRDYNCTEELTCEDMKDAFINVEWSDVKNMVNTDISLEGTVINIGGNTSAGYDLIQEFESVYISQSIVAREIDLLKSKITLANAITTIHSALINVLETYYDIGYLIQTQYDGSDIYRNIGGRNICILARGEVVTGGYKIIILPRVAGSDIHTFPEIEIILNTNKGIRFIKTTGLVL